MAPSHQIRSRLSAASMKLRVLMLGGLALLQLAGVSAAAAKSDFTEKDAQVLGRSIGYIGDGMSGVAIVGVAFEPTSVDSQREADRIRTIVGTDLKTGRVQLEVRLIVVDELVRATGISAIYVTAGLNKRADMVLSAAQRLHVPTISADLACVEAGECVLGYSSEPTVQILINQGAAERIGVRFLQAFRMLVKEQ
jgi:hypothetical protein